MISPSLPAVPLEAVADPARIVMRLAENSLMHDDISEYIRQNVPVGRAGPHPSPAEQGQTDEKTASSR